MKSMLLLMGILVSRTELLAQLETVQLNPGKRQFNDGGRLPAEKSFLITSQPERGVSLVQLQILPDGSSDRVLYESYWKQRVLSGESAILIPVRYQLKSGREYSFNFSFYRDITPAERQQLADMLQTTVKTYLQSNIRTVDGKNRLFNSPSNLFHAMNEVLRSGLQQYQTRSGTETLRFSSLLETMLRNQARERNAENDSTYIL